MTQPLIRRKGRLRRSEQPVGVIIQQITKDNACVSVSSLSCYIGSGGMPRRCYGDCLLAANDICLRKEAGT